MSYQVTRRRFLQQGSAGSLSALTTASQFSAFSVGELWAEVANPRTPTSFVLSAAHSKVLRTVADEIIPSADGCLAATEAGTADYIEVLLAKAPDLQKQMQAALTRLDRLSQLRFGQPFDRLNSAQRVKLLHAFEKEQAKPRAGEALYLRGNLFATLRDLVYEGYYTSPKVWPQLDYEFHPTNGNGPTMSPFDESILAIVRARAKNYRS